MYVWICSLFLWRDESKWRSPLTNVVLSDESSPKMSTVKQKHMSVPLNLWLLIYNPQALVINWEYKCRHESSFVRSIKKKKKNLDKDCRQSWKHLVSYRFTAKDRFRPPRHVDWYQFVPGVWSDPTETNQGKNSPLGADEKSCWKLCHKWFLSLKLLLVSLMLILKMSLQ